MKTIRVLQLASFEGNIGDNANHCGARQLLRKNLNVHLEFTNLEIREFFWGERQYDLEFAKYVNSFDLFIFGGGNFFELWVDHSCNNTSVDIDVSILKAIKIPTIFYSLGLDPGLGVSDKGIIKFKKWLDFVNSEKRFILSLRNDGSLDAAKQYLGEDYASHFHVVPDGGFFTEVSDHFHIELPIKKTIIGLNLAGDILNIRFPKNKTNSISYEQFLIKLGDLFNSLFDNNDNLHLVVFPHIYKDLDIISQFIHKLKDKHARRKVTVAPYLHGEGAQEYIFNAYSKCDLIMGNRFHTNVCAIGLKIPTIGFINYRQIEMLYKELDLMDRTVFVNEKDFDEKLLDKINSTLENSDKVSEVYGQKRQALIAEVNRFHHFVNEWLASYL